MRKNSRPKHRSLSGKIHEKECVYVELSNILSQIMDNYVDALPQDMIKWTTIIILSDRCANLFYQEICYLNLYLVSPVILFQ